MANQAAQCWAQQAATCPAGKLGKDLGTGEIGIGVWEGIVSNLILYEATGTWEGSKLHQGSETSRARQEARGIVKVPWGD